MTGTPSGEVILYQRDDGTPAIEVRLDADTVWLNQQQIAELFQTTRENITIHLGNVYDEGELERGATSKDFLQVRTEGTRTVNRKVSHYNLDAVISVGYRIKSKVEVDKRTVSEHLRNIFDSGELAQGATVRNFRTVQTEGTREVALSTWANAPEGKIVRTDVTVGKNYLSQDELSGLGLLVSAFLDLAESLARRRVPMTMADWAQRLDAYLQLANRGLLTDAGSITKAQADEFALAEFEKFRITQDREFVSDFDKFLDLPNLDGEGES